MADEIKGGAQPPYLTADKIEGFSERAEGAVERLPHLGKSVTPGLEQIQGSTAQPTAAGDPVAHVVGPQQAACDPIAAGLYVARKGVAEVEPADAATEGGIPAPGNAQLPAPQAPAAAAPGSEPTG